MLVMHSSPPNLKLWQIPGLIPSFIAVGAAFGSWSLLLPVVPLAVFQSHAGGAEALAGSVTGVFMAATVLTQVITPALLRGLGYRPVVLFSAVMLGIPALGHIMSLEAAPLLLVSGLRGVGFGALTVAGAALMAELAPPALLGKASGLLGLTVGCAKLMCLPAGMLAAERFGFTPVYVAAMVVGLIAAVVCLWIPRLKAAPVGGGPARAATPTWRAVALPAAVMAAMAVGFAAVSTFFPATAQQVEPSSGVRVAAIALSVLGLLEMVSRFGAGIIADRRGFAGSVTVPALLVGCMGLAAVSGVVALGLSVWWLVVAAAVFGAGFGAVQNESLLRMFQRLPKEKLSLASAVWNISFDAGTGCGAFLLGYVAHAFSLSWVFYLAAAIIFVVTIMTVVLARPRIRDS